MSETTLNTILSFLLGGCISFNIIKIIYLFEEVVSLDIMIWAIFFPCVVVTNFTLEHRHLKRYINKQW